MTSPRPTPPVRLPSLCQSGAPLTPFFPRAVLAAQDVAVRCREIGITALHIKIRATGGTGTKTPGPGAQSALRALARAGMRIGRIEGALRRAAQSNWPCADSFPPRCRRHPRPDRLDPQEGRTSRTSSLIERLPQSTSLLCLSHPSRPPPCRTRISLPRQVPPKARLSRRLREGGPDVRRTLPSLPIPHKTIYSCWLQWRGDNHPLFFSGETDAGATVGRSGSTVFFCCKLVDGTEVVRVGAGLCLALLPRLHLVAS